MNIMICNDSRTYIWNFHLPINAWYGCDSEGWWLCTVHGKPENGNELELRRFDGVRWYKVRENSSTSQAICQWATAKKLWWSKCHWHKSEDAEKCLVAKHERHMRRIENLMSHDRKRKPGSSGVRLDKENFYANKLFTDYECASNGNKLHDFKCYR